VEIADWINDNAGAIQASQFINGLAVIALTWWVGSLFRKMARAEGGRPRLSVVAIVGFVFGGVFALASGAILSAAALRVDELGEGTQVFFTLSLVFISTSGFGLVAALSAINALSMRTKMLPQWITYLGLVAAVLMLIGTIGSASDAGAFMVFGVLGFLVWSIWILGVSYELWKHPTSATAPTPASAAAVAA
jgi:hypothetical protein